MKLKIKTENGLINLTCTKAGNLVAQTSITQYESYTTPCMNEVEAIEYLMAAAQRELAQAQKFLDLVSELQKAQELELQEAQEPSKLASGISEAIASRYKNTGLQVQR